MRNFLGHGIEREHPNITVSNVYYPNDIRIKVHPSEQNITLSQGVLAIGMVVETGAPPAWVDKFLSSLV